MLSLRTRRGTGWLPDEPDARDDLAPLSWMKAPESATLVHPAVTPRDQGRTSACVGFALAQAYELAAAHQGVLTGDLSPLFTYTLARLQDGTHGDTGTRIRSAIKALGRHGIASERAWPMARRRLNKTPSFRAYRDAFDRRGLRRYYRVYGADQVRAALAQGFPVVGGWFVGREFLDYRGDGQVTHDPDGRNGHALCVVGYAASGFSLLNSWGTGWGSRGYARVTEDFIRHGRDLWALNISA